MVSKEFGELILAEIRQDRILELADEIAGLEDQSTIGIAELCVDKIEALEARQKVLNEVDFSLTLAWMKFNDAYKQADSNADVAKACREYLGNFRKFLDDNSEDPFMNKIREEFLNRGVGDVEKEG